MAPPRGEQEQRGPVGVLAAAFLFNLGQGVLRPSMPLYLEQSFVANYRMVTLIPVVFGAGKWIANLPTGYLLGRFGRWLMICGLLVIAFVDVASIATSRYAVFLGFRALGGVGWAMFATVATTAVVNLPVAQRRGRAVSLLLMSETSGLLLGSAAGGWLYQGVGIASPFLFEATCMVVAAIAVGRWASIANDAAPTRQRSRDGRLLGTVLRTPGVFLMGITNALLTAIQTGVLVFLFPLYLLKRGGLSPEAVGFLVSLGVLGRLMALWLGGNVSDRWGRTRVLIPGLLIYAILLGSMSRLTQPVVLAVCSFAIGAAAGFVAAIPTVLTSDQVERALQGVAIGWLRTMSDSGQIAGPLLMGALAGCHRSLSPVSVRSSTPHGNGMAVSSPREGHSGRRCCRRTRLMTIANGRVLVVAAHPDDPEFLAGGTVAGLAKGGREIAYVIVTNGSKGSGDPNVTSEQLIPIREEEQRRAARVLGVGGVEFLGYEDGELEDTRNLRRDVTREIRRWRPDLIITLNPYRTYNNFPGWHRDHRTTARVVLDCVYPLARDHLSFPELLPDYEPHKVREVYSIRWDQPRLVIDITDTMDLKLEAIRCHASQVGDFKAVEARVRNRAATLGKEKGYSYAEGFDHIIVPQ